MKFHDPGPTKAAMLAGLRALAAAEPGAIRKTAETLFAPDAAYIAGHPFDQMRGLDELTERYLAPLKRAFPDLERRDDIFIGGHWQDHDWVSATGYYYGVMRGEWMGLKPTGGWVYLRFGEFYKLHEGRIVDAYCLLDLIDILRQIGANPVRPALGVEGLCPGPAAQDGLQIATNDPAASRKSLDLVQAMIFQGMHGFDGVDHGTMHFERYFSEDMMWYGPGGTGTTRGLEGFMKFHEIPFNEAWPDFKGGDHKSRFGDGPFICSTGWPSIRGTHTGGDWMGLKPTGRPFTMRVMDWWRREGDWLTENWIFIDVPDLFRQFDRDLIAEAQARQAERLETPFRP